MSARLQASQVGDQVVDLAGIAMPLQVRREMLLVVAGLTFASGLDYVVRYGMKAWGHPR